MMEMLTNLVTQSGVGATQLSAILLGVLFLTMIIGLATGQELAFVLGGAGVIIGYLAWGGPGITIAMTKVYDQMQSYSNVRADGKLFDTFQGCGWAVPLYPLPAWSSEGRSRSGSDRGFHRVRCHDRYRRRIRCYHGHAVRTGAAEVRL